MALVNPCHRIGVGANLSNRKGDELIQQQLPFMKPSGASFLVVSRTALTVRSSLKNYGEQKELHEVVNRRDVLRLGSAAAVFGWTLPSSIPYSVNGITERVANAADLTQRFQRGEFLNRVKDKLRETVYSNQDLVPDLLKLALNDALTYDKATNTGGANGSIRFELDRPENEGLERAMRFLEAIKSDLDERLSKWGALSWADLIQFAAQIATKRTFIDSAVSKCAGDEQKGLYLYNAYGSSGQWGQFDKQLGRADSTGPDPEGRVPIWDNASPSEIRTKFAEIGIKPRYISVMSAFFGQNQIAVESKLSADREYTPYVQKYQDSRRTVSQTDYEVDLINTFSRLSVLGQSINYEAYTYKDPPRSFKF